MDITTNQRGTTNQLLDFLTSAHVPMLPHLGEVNKSDTVAPGAQGAKRVSSWAFCG